MPDSGTRCSRLTRRLLVAGLGISLASCNAVLGPSSRDANWRVYDTTHFSLHVRPGSFAEQHAPGVGAMLDDQYDATLKALDAQFGGRVSAFLYNSAGDGNLEGDHSGSAFPDTLSFEAACVAPYDDSLLALLAHEANHVIIINALGRAGTYMMTEGLASAVLSERYQSLGRTYYYAWTKSHLSQLPPLATLVDDDKWHSVDENLAYSTSASFLAYLLETGGASRLRQLYSATSPQFASRFADIYGRSLVTAQAEWLEWCKKYTW
jgi:predicted Zn-dependent protease DUF2268